jgi:hypothetical protein
LDADRFRLVELLRRPELRPLGDGTFAPFFRASESPIAIACFLLLTFRPDLPLLSVPAFRFFMARSTFFDAPLEYFRFFAFLAIAPILQLICSRNEWNSQLRQRFISSTE